MVLEVKPAPRYFGAWTNLDSESNVLLKSEVYQVESDGFLIVYDTSEGGEVGAAMTVKTDGINPPTTVRAQYRDPDGDTLATLTVPIRKNDYWKVTWEYTCVIYWLPICNGVCVKQV